jgi:DeoR family transcriptional regulator of aga operon
MGRGFEIRRQKILEYLGTHSEAKVPQLVELTGAAVATIHRDLLLMESQNELVRTHGGVRAVDQPSLVERTFEQRIRQNHLEKLAIATAAARLVKPGMTIVIDSGTTCWSLASLLKTKTPLRIITSALAVIESLGSVRDIEINLVSGRFRVDNLDFYGALSVDTFRQFHADMAFLGCDGLLPKRGAFSHDAESAAISHAMSECAAESVLLCDSSKIGKGSSFLVLSPKQISTIVTDKPIQELQEAEYRVIVAKASTGK